MWHFNAALKLGLPLIPAYNNPGTKGKKILQGVNFASGGSGIDSHTGKLYVNARVTWIYLFKLNQIDKKIALSFI